MPTTNVKQQGVTDALKEHLKKSLNFSKNVNSFIQILGGPVLRVDGTPEFNMNDATTFFDSLIQSGRNLYSGHSPNFFYNYMKSKYQNVD